MAEQRYQAVLAVISDGLSISQVAGKVGVSRQTLHTWLARYEAEGLDGLIDRSHRPARCPHQMPADVEAALLELRRSRPYWGPRRLVFELAKREVAPVPSESAAYRLYRDRDRARRKLSLQEHLTQSANRHSFLTATSALNARPNVGNLTRRAATRLAAAASLCRIGPTPVSQTLAWHPLHAIGCYIDPEGAPGVGRVGTTRASRAAMSVAAVGVATAVAGVAATQPASISAPLVDLAALIVVGSSTHPDGSGNENFFHGMFDAPPYNTGDNLEHVNFFTGPFGISQALQAHDGEQNAVLSSGWGAANASLLLMQLQAQKDPALPQTLFILDNNVARPDGGFGTRYPWFALIGVNPLPSPTDTDALGIVDVGYEYDYNSNAPSDVLNPVAAVNSLVAYLYRHLNQNELDLPVNTDGSPAVTCGTANTCGITDNGAVLECPDAQCGAVPADDRVAAYVTQRGNTTYVTYTSNGLPLTNLIRAVVPFGNVIADLTEPVLTEIVNSAYPNGNPISADPSKYQPAQPFSSLIQLATTAAKIPGAIQQGLTAATGSEPKTTAKIAITAADATSSSKKTTATPEETPKPLTNVVRDSEKAVPQSGVGEDASSSTPDPVAAVDKPAKDEPQESAQSESSTSSGADTETGKS